MKEDLKKSSVSFTYDPVKDIAPVDQFGFVDLREAFINNCVPGDLVTKMEDYNGVEDPDSLIGRSADVFEAYRKAKAVESARSVTEPSGEGTTSGETE